MDLSIVVIARNEGKDIGDCLGSVLLAVEEAKKAKVIETAEVIFVDSASTDRTVEIARGFPVKIIELDRNWPLSAAAGIFSGYRYASGTFFGVIDGDSRVDRYWFSDALPFLQRDGKVGGVYGEWDECSKGKGFLLKSVMRARDASKVSEAREVEFVGNGLFKREALDSVGGHNPYLKGAEDKDISFRLRQAGYKLLLVPVKFAVHNWHFSLLEYYRSVSVWSKGEGQAAACARNNGNLQVFKWFSERYSLNILLRKVRHSLLLFALLASVGGMVFHSMAWSWMVLVLLAILAVILLRIKKTNQANWRDFIIEYFNSIVETLYRFYYFYRGLRLETPDPIQYPYPSLKDVEDSQKSFHTRIKIGGTVRSGEFCMPMENAEIRVLDSLEVEVGKTYTDSHGKWEINEAVNGRKMVIRKEGYVTKEYDINQMPRVVRMLEDKIIGYQNKLWFKPSEEVSAYVHSSQSYSAKLMRHGLKKECVLDLGVRQAHKQDLPDDYFVEKGLNWQDTFRYKIPAAAVPGLYSLLLESNNHEKFAIPLAVTTAFDGSFERSKIVVLASIGTWISYNVWGGRNRYRNFEELVDGGHGERSRFKRNISRITPTTFKYWIKKLMPANNKKEVSWPHKNLSIRRPFTNCDLEGENVFQFFTNHLAAGEWRVLAWLERENIAYDIISPAELHANTNILKNSRAIILNTHSEYWSRKMFKAVRSFYKHDKGWIINLSGNSMFREIEFQGDDSVKYVGIFHQTCCDEVQILGVRFSETDYGTCAPYKIVVDDHWAFSGLSVHKGNVFGQESLNRHTAKDSDEYDPGRPGLGYELSGTGASGWETDKVAKSSPKDIRIIAKGLNSDGGADMVIREPKGARGGLFSASSIVFGGCLLIDETASGIVRNVINRALGKPSGNNE